MGGENISFSGSRKENQMNDNAKVFSLIEMREMMIDTSGYQMMEEVGEFTGTLEMKAQDKENLPTSETITIFTPEEIKIFKDEAFSTFSNGKRKYQQAAAYILMLNTGLRTGEALGLLNSDIDLDNRVMHLNRGVKEISKVPQVKDMFR